MASGSYYKMYSDNQGYWRWTFYAANHEPIAVSSEGYVHRRDCEHSIGLVKASYDSPVYAP